MGTLLVVDRRRKTRRELRSLLETRYWVLAVHNVFSAFRVLRRRRLDMVLVKSAARDAYAIAVLKWLRLHGVRVPVVVVLESTSSRDARIIRQLGVSSLLRWPVRREELLSAIASAEIAPQAAGASEERPNARSSASRPVKPGTATNGATGSSQSISRSAGRSARYRDHHRAARYICSRGRGRLV